jgi:ferritin-like metal-binding protein YciE
MAHKELLINWLNDAYSMETALIPILENHAKDAKNYPDIQARDQQHIEETRRHAERVRSCIERLGESPSTLKTGMGSLIGNMQSVMTGAFQDELVKNCLSDFAAENFEIASYKALIAAAQEIGDQETVLACQENLREDEAMAQWLDQHLPIVVQETVRQKVQEDGS